MVTRMHLIYLLCTTLQKTFKKGEVTQVEFLKDIIYINKMAGKKVYELFLKNWLIIFTGLIYSTITIVINIMLTPFFMIPIFNILAGFALYFISAALLSSYFYILYSVIKYQKFEFQDIKRGLRTYLYEITRILFIGWIAGMVAFNVVVPILSNSMGGYLSPTTLTNIITIIVLIALNPLPEVIYLKRRTGLEGIQYTFEYMKENWIEWMIPNIILLGLLYMVTGKIMISLFSTGISFNPSILTIRTLGLYLIGQIIFSFTMIYRGVLMEILSTSTRRKRMFMRNTYK